MAMSLRLRALARQLQGNPTEASSPGAAVGAKGTKTPVVAQEGTEKVIFDKLNFPEAPRWHDGQLLFVNMASEHSPSGKGETGRMHSLGPDGADHKVEVDMKTPGSLRAAWVGSRTAGL